MVWPVRASTCNCEQTTRNSLQPLIFPEQLIFTTIHILTFIKSYATEALTKTFSLGILIFSNALFLFKPAVHSIINITQVPHGLQHGTYSITYRLKSHWKVCFCPQAHEIKWQSFVVFVAFLN